MLIIVIALIAVLIVLLIDNVRLRDENENMRHFCTGGKKAWKR
jgi:competence protein ComGC